MSKRFPTPLQQLKGVEQENAAYLQQQREAIATIEQLTKEREELRDQLIAINTQVNDIHQKAKTIIPEMIEQIESLRQERNEAHAAATSLTTQVNDLRAQVRDCINAAQEINATLKHTAQYVRGLEEALEALTREEWAGEMWINEFTYGCAYCDASQQDTSEGFTHKPDCLMTKARRALAAKEDRE